MTSFASVAWAKLLSALHQCKSASLEESDRYAGRECVGGRWEAAGEVVQTVEAEIANVSISVKQI